MAVAQDCKIESDKVDDFTGVRTRSTVSEKFAHAGSKGNHLSAWAVHADSLYVLVFNPFAKLRGCSSKDAYVIVKFTDGTTLRFEHGGEINCSHPYVVAYCHPDDFEGKTVEKVRLGTTETTADYDADDGAALIRLLNCVK
jgi:hypothetical protein